MGNVRDITVSDLIGSTDSTGASAMGRHSQVLNFVRQYPEGVTSKLVANYVGLSSERARVILEDLVKMREIYKRELPEKFNMYYRNGKLIHKYLQESKNLGDQIFRISFHEGKVSPKIQIREKGNILC